MVLRGCLEIALYGLYVARNEARQEIWLRRHDDDLSRRRVASDFTIRNVLENLQSADAKTHTVAKRLYEQTIDLGGHPNERTVSTQIETKTSGSHIEFTAEYVLCGDISHKLCLKTAAQIGICCLDIFAHVFEARYRLLGIDMRLDAIRQPF